MSVRCRCPVRRHWLLVSLIVFSYAPMIRATDFVWPSPATPVMSLNLGTGGPPGAWNTEARHGFGLRRIARARAWRRLTEPVPTLPHSARVPHEQPHRQADHRGE